MNEPHPDTLSIIDEAIHKSGYAMTDRERFIAAWFFEEGAKKVTIQKGENDE
jgi:hypothetical protein